MSTQFRICQNRGLFRDNRCKRPNSKFVSYRMVICSALHKAVNSVPEAESEDVFKAIIVQLRHLSSRLEELHSGNEEQATLHLQAGLQTIPFHENMGLIEWLAFKQTNDEAYGAVIIDKTDGCYPLVLYHKDPLTADRDDRLAAFIHAINNPDNGVCTEKNSTEIYKEIKKEDNWDEGLLSKVHQILFGEPPPSIPANDQETA